MIERFLKFTNKAEAESIFAGLGLQLSSGTQVLGPQRIDADILFGTGEILASTGETMDDGDGNLIEIKQPMAGYHVNIRYSGETLPEILENKSIIPQHPICVWA